MIKKVGYYIFAAFFSVFRICPVRADHVFFVATHDDSEEGNIGIVSAALREKKPEFKQFFLTKRDGIRHPFSFFVGKAYHMATAGTIFMDNEFMPMAYMKFSKKVKVVQLWHGTGSIKKFGLDAEEGEVAELAERANRCITHLIVNSDLTKKQYAGAFKVPMENIYITGLPRTDLILDREKMEQKSQKFYGDYPDLEKKRCILYAPTFRDSEVHRPEIHMDLAHLVETLGENDVLMLRLHPHVAANYSEGELAKYRGKVLNMSGYRGVATLLSVADCLITDYSSIVFEYCLLGKPMVFYAYDLEKFKSEGRGFYENYETYVPGPVVRTQEELGSCLRKWEFSEEIVSRFAEKSYHFRDKNAVERLFELIF